MIFERTLIYSFCNPSSIYFGMAVSLLTGGSVRVPQLGDEGLRIYLGPWHRYLIHLSAMRSRNTSQPANEEEGAPSRTS